MSVIVEYEIHKGREQDFAALIRDHARRTLFEEDGCLRFEVLQPVDDNGVPVPDRMMVSELYADEAALRVHIDHPRMAGFGQASEAMLKSRKRILARLVEDRLGESGLSPEELNASNDG